jgi:lipoyl(octanoyl) transferase
VSSAAATTPSVIDLGRVSYSNAYQIQLAHHEEVLAARDSGTPDPGRILLVEHDPVITISRRAGAAAHLLATAAQLERAGVAVAETDRGGDITYHGPGQLVVYPILDLNFYQLGLHAYMRLLEQTVIDTLAGFGVAGERDPTATGVWVRPREGPPDGPAAKIAAMGVRVRRWVSMHGLSLNVAPDLRHFDLIVPCGLAGRGVTSLEAELAPDCPSMPQAKESIAASLTALLAKAREDADERSAQKKDPGSEGSGAPT